MEDNILNALTSFTASFLAEELKECRLTGEWLSKLQQNKNEIKIIWQDFFEHVKSNEQSCHNLCENLNTYLINGELDFACDRSFDYNSFVYGNPKVYHLVIEKCTTSQSLAKLHLIQQTSK